MSKRYVEVEPLIKLIDEYIEEYDTLEDGYHNPKWCAMQEARRSIEKQPIANVIEVVRCRDCKYNDLAGKDSVNVLCRKFYGSWQADDYCSYWEQKDV